MKFIGSEAYYASNAPYLFSWQHFLLMGILIIVCFGGPFLLKKANEKTVWWIVFRLWLAQVIMEIIKLTLMTIVEGGFPFHRVTPIHISSWFIYTTPLYLWGKGTLKRIGLSFLCTMSFFGGLCNFFFPTALNIYPVFSLFGFHAILFHAIMVFVGMLLWIKEFKPQWQDIFLAFIPTTLASIVTITVDYTFGWNFMFYYTGKGTPLFLLNGLPQVVYTCVVFIGYFLVTCLFVFVPIWIKKLTNNKIKTGLTN